MVDEVDNASIDEILNSIKKYISSNANSSEEIAETGTDNRIEVVRLPPAFEDTNEEVFTPQKKEDYEHIQMPDFIQKVPEQSTNSLSPQAKNCSTNPVEKEKLPAASVDSAAVTQNTKDGTTGTIKEFISNVSSLVNTVQKKSSSHECSFDAFLATEIKKAVSSWINENMQSIVQEIVEAELRRITEKLI